MKWLLVRLLLVVLCGGFFVASKPAHAVLPACGHTYTFYSDSTFVTQVGEKTINCNGSQVNTGTVSNYYTLDCVGCGSCDCDGSGYECSNGTVTATYGSYYTVGTGCVRWVP